MKPTGNTVLLTGGTSGIGLALLQELVDRGNQVIVVARNQNRWELLRARFPSVVFRGTDLTNSSAINELTAWISIHFPNLNLLINNAGVQYNYLIGNDKTDAECISYEINTNLTAPLLLTHALLPLLRQQPVAAVVNVTSGLAFSPKRSAAVYCATKAGLRNFTKALRYQLTGTNVQVTEAICPLVDTPMTTGRGKGKISPEQVATELLAGLAAGKAEVNIGKTKLFRIIHRWLPSLADRILRDG